MSVKVTIEQISGEPMMFDGSGGGGGGGQKKEVIVPEAGTVSRAFECGTYYVCEGKVSLLEVISVEGEGEFSVEFTAESADTKLRMSPEMRKTWPGSTSFEADGTGILTVRNNIAGLEIVDYSITIGADELDILPGYVECGLPWRITLPAATITKDDIGGATTLSLVSGKSLTGAGVGGTTVGVTLFANGHALSLNSLYCGSYVFGGDKNGGSGYSGLTRLVLSGGAQASNAFGGSNYSESGTYTGDSAITAAADVSASMENRLLAAGHYVTGSIEVTVIGDTFLVVDDASGLVNKGGYVLGGSYVTGADFTCNGDASVSIASGTFQCVAGSGLITSAAASYAHDGDIDVMITGGTFLDTSSGSGFVFGGVCSTKKDYVTTNVTIAGDITMTFDSSGNSIMLNAVYGGCDGDGSIDGNIFITFTGDGGNLTFAGTSPGVIGDNLSASHRKGVRGTRTLIFNAFTGEFGAPSVTMFDEIRFVNGSTVTGSMRDLSGIDMWTFDADSSFTWNEPHDNDFSGSTLSFGKRGDTGTAGTVFFRTDEEQGVGGFDDFRKVTIFGENAEYDEEDGDYGSWHTDDWKIVLEETDDEEYLLVLRESD